MSTCPRPVVGSNVGTRNLNSAKLCINKGVSRKVRLTSPTPVHLLCDVSGLWLQFVQPRHEPVTLRFLFDGAGSRVGGFGRQADVFEPNKRLLLYGGRIGDG